MRVIGGNRQFSGDGQGGGGGGGPSYAILVGPDIAPTIRLNIIAVGSGGTGGTGGAAGLGGSPGGSGGCCAFLLETAGDPGIGGEGGWSFAVLDTDPNDGVPPVLEGNTITVGVGGNGGAIGGASGLAGERNF